MKNISKDNILVNTSVLVKRIHTLKIISNVLFVIICLLSIVGVLLLKNA